MSRSQQQRRRPMQVELLEDRLTPASPSGPAHTVSLLNNDLLAKFHAALPTLPSGSAAHTGLQSEIDAVTPVESAFESGYRAISGQGSVYGIANVISVFLHAERRAFNSQANNGQFSAATRQIFAQAFDVVSPEVDALESWFFTATSNHASADSILSQLTQFATAFQTAEQAQVQAQISEYKDGMTVANGAFTYTNPTFWNAGQNKYHQATIAGSGGLTFTTPPTNSAPIVTLQPGARSATVGQSVSFSVATSGTPTPTVQWQVSTNNGSTFTNLTNGTGIAGATTGTLTLSNLTAGLNNNRYRAVFTNSVGSVNSNAATLTVNVTPQVTTQPTSRSAVVAGSATFTVAATGTPTPTVQWQVSTNGGSTFTNLVNGTGIAGATTTTLTLTSLTAAQTNSVYHAVFTNAGGSVNSASASLTVTATAVIPQITTQPSSQSATAGSNITFTAGATGSPTPTVQWQVSTNGGTTFTNLSDGTGVSGSTTTALVLTGLTSTLSSNQYHAIFTNSGGSATTSAATLTVNLAPQITTQPTNQTAAVGASVSFTVAASGTPTPIIQWQVSTNGGTTFTNLANGTNVSGATTATLTLTGLTAGLNANKYRAVVTNAIGTANSNPATLTVS